MKKRVVCFLVLCLFILPNTVFAADWVYIGRGHSKFAGDYDAYVDKDRIEKNGDSVTFWEMEVLDKADQATGNKKAIFKLQAVTSNPRQYRALEFYAYDADDKELWHISNPTDFGPVGPPVSQEIDFVLQ